ncbi:TetR/AcrR family transcriptional regulator [Nocardia terpenica]|uniref:TetR family transcriptional regulator n=1 Tax=Nocardia terpenica TaxID=455432 RepID=A0A6G9Z6S1_9NOCA|nr:TetR/AcrR family transcriptional regulator [Nocardia terpenica]QIS21150.1 TetR family transcriptional regulator [Nocardia terpenica]
MARTKGFDTDTVLGQAMDAFWTHGYANTSPARLAEVTGLNKSSLYNAFGSKRELFDQALARYHRGALELTDKFLQRPGTARECIGALFRYLTDNDVARQYPRGCLMVNTITEFDGTDTEMARVLHRMQERSMEMLADRIEQGRRDGDVRTDIDPRTTAEFLVNTLNGLRVTAKTHDAATLHRIIDTALAAL